MSATPRPTRAAPAAAMFLGSPPKRCKSKTMVLCVRGYRSKWWSVVCLGPKSHYRKTDGGCEHTDEVLRHARPEIRDRIKLDPFGGKEKRSR